MRLALNYPRTPGFERVPCRAPAFGLRQLAGAFARGTVESEAAWLALVEKSGDKSPQSKRCRACETACRTSGSLRAKRIPQRRLRLCSLQRSRFRSRLRVLAHWTLDVGRWMFDVQTSPPSMKVSPLLLLAVVSALTGCSKPADTIALPAAPPKSLTIFYTCD